MAESNRVKIIYTPETVYGVTPASATWETMRWTSASLSTTVNTVESSEVRADRMIADQKKVGISVGGGVDFEFSADTFDTFLEAATCGTWTTGTLKTGAVDRSFSIEEEFADINSFINFKGMRVGTFELNIAYGEILTGNVSFAGNGYSTPVSSAVGAGTVNPATTNTVLNASSDIGSVKIDSLVTPICLRSMSINIDNSMREITCVGSEAPKDQKKGTSRVTGSVDMYLGVDSFDLYKQMIANGEVEFEFTVSDGTDTYTFTIPKAKLSGDAPSVDGLDSDVMFSVDYTALYDATEDTNFKVVKS